MPYLPWVNSVWANSCRGFLSILLIFLRSHLLGTYLWGVPLSFHIADLSATNCFSDHCYAPCLSLSFPDHLTWQNLCSMNCWIHPLILASKQKHGHSRELSALSDPAEGEHPGDIALAHLWCSQDKPHQILTGQHLSWQDFSRIGSRERQKNTKQNKQQTKTKQKNQAMLHLGVCQSPEKSEHYLRLWCQCS